MIKHKCSLSLRLETTKFYHKNEFNTRRKHKMLAFKHKT